MGSIPVLANKFSAIWPLLDERTRRIMAANEAMGLGYGGVSVVHRACGLSRKAIVNGIKEIEEGSLPLAGRIRRPGGGRKNLTESDPALLAALDDLIDPCGGSAKAHGRWPPNFVSNNIRSAMSG
jgi:hypothetical protein